MSTKSRYLQNEIDKYVEDNIKTANLKDLAEQLGYSLVYTGSLVKKLTGDSFTKYVQKKRCERAAHKMLHSDMQIEEIIREVGYENESFFRRIFIEKFGEKPLEFRKRKHN